MELIEFLSSYTRALLVCLSAVPATLNLHMERIAVSAANGSTSDIPVTGVADHRVDLIGVEAPSGPDVNDRPEVTEVHQILLCGNELIVEG